MVIPGTGTFAYQADFTKEGFSDSDIVLYGRNQHAGNEVRLVGHKPMIRFWEGRLIIVAADSDRGNAQCRMISFPFGDAVSLAAKAGDSLYVARTGTGHIGLSLLRDKRLILAIGAITSVPLGNGASAAAVHRELRDWDTAEIGGYYIYVENTWIDGVPGIAECISVCLADEPQMKIASMRSAIILAHGSQKIVDW